VSDCGHITCKVYVTLTWLDGSTEQHRCHSATVRDGVLVMAEADVNPRTARCVPLTSIREYSIKDYGW
jgi:hypothetical protein